MQMHPCNKVNKRYWILSRIGLINLQNILHNLLYIQYVRTMVSRNRAQKLGTIVYLLKLQQYRLAN